jgi:two-component system, OmpR family, response regulator
MNVTANEAVRPAALPANHVCIVDDDQQVRALLADYLSRNGLRVGTFPDGPSLRRFLARGRADLVVLDVMLPAEDGLAICRWLKAETDLPVVMLTAKGDEIDRVVGLELGADDYVCKPFSPRELLARIRNLLRLTEHRQRPAGAAPRRLRFAGWTLDTMERILRPGEGAAHRLSGCEYQLLHTLLTQANRVLSRSHISESIYGRQLEPFDRSVDVLISRLRQLLGDNARDPRIIRTVYGRGYMLTGLVSEE